MNYMARVKQNTQAPRLTCWNELEWYFQLLPPFQCFVIKFKV